MMLSVSRLIVELKGVNKCGKINIPNSQYLAILLYGVK